MSTIEPGDIYGGMVFKHAYSARLENVAIDGDRSPNEKPESMFRIEAEPNDADARLLALLGTATFAPGVKLTLPSGEVVVPTPDTQESATADAHAKLTAALDLLADVSYHEASLPPRVQRAARAAHRAVAKAAQRAGER